MKTTFTTTIQATGNNTGIEVPPENVAALGSSKKPAVTVTVSGYSYPSTVAVMGGKFMIPLSKAHRETAGLRAGDQVEVTLELETAPAPWIFPMTWRRRSPPPEQKKCLTHWHCQNAKNSFGRLKMQKHQKRERVALQKSSRS